MTAKHRIAVLAVTIATLAVAAPALAGPQPRNPEAVVFQPNRTPSTTLTGHQGAVDGWISRIRSTRAVASYPEHQARPSSSPSPATPDGTPGGLAGGVAGLGAVAGFALTLLALAAVSSRRRVVAS